MTRRRAPQSPFERLASGTRAQRTAAAGRVVNAAPVPAQASAVAQALSSVAGSDSGQLSKIDQFTLAGDAPQDLTLTYLPKFESWNVSISHLPADQGDDYEVDGQTLRILAGSLAPLADDTVQIQYDYLAGLATEPDEFVPEGLLLWLRAIDVSGANDDPITTWEDQSGNNNDATGTGTSGAKPVLKTGQTTDGGKAVYVDSTSNSRRFTFADFLTGTTAAEVFLVVKAVNDPAPAHDGHTNGLWKFGAQGGSNDACHYPYDDGNIYDDFGSTTRQNVGNPTPSLTGWHIYNVLTESNLWEARLDGTLLYSSPGSVVGWSTTPVLGITPKSGSLTETGQFYFAELMICDGVLSSEDRNTLLADLASRHGITL